MSQERHSSPIAIVGVSCRLPGGANSPQELWRLLAKGTNTWSHVPADRYNEHAFLHPDPDDTNGSHNHPGGHFITQDIRDFDNDFFNISPQEAAAMDPQQRILLETVYEALESGGHLQRDIQGSATSVHVAMFIRDYDHNIFKDPLNIPRHQVVGTGEAILANRISHVFDLHGPSMTLDTGCSGGLVAVHQACQTLRLRESDMAIAGAANLIISPDHQIGMSNLHMLSNDGRSWPFDSRGTGYGRGEGFAAFVLKRLEDAMAAGDAIRGIILGSAVNQDGRTTVGITSPSGAAQAALQTRLYKQLRLDPLSVAYVEAHGTGTVAGDREEINALAEVFCRGRKNPLYVGSIKSNIGHLESVSGLAGLVKSLLVLEHFQIPANADFLQEKEGLQLQSRKITVPTATTSWPGSASPLISLNSFGYGGTNAHMILEPGPKKRECSESDHGTPRLFLLSAKSKTSMEKSISQYRNLTSENTTLPSCSLSHTLCNRRNHFPWRFSCVAKNVQELSQQLASGAKPRASSSGIKDAPINFVFTGQGSQWAGMGRDLLSIESLPGFSTSIQKSSELLKSLGASWDLVEEILGGEAESRLHLADLAQPVTTAIQLALVDMLAQIGIRPSAVIGHSSGEIAASYAAGHISQATALRVAYYRGFTPEIVRKNGCSEGAMLAVGLGEDGVAKYFAQVTRGIVTTACVNSPQSVTVSGDVNAIDELASILRAEDVFFRKLRVNVAYHSYHMQAAAKEYDDLIGPIPTEHQQQPIDFYSTVSGKIKSTGFDAQYWVNNLVSKVRFQEGIQELCQAQKASKQIFIEIGPHNTLAGPTKQNIEAMSDTIEMYYLSPLRRGVGAIRSLLEALGKLFEYGKQIDFSILSDLDPSMRAAEVLSDLPGYSWDHGSKHWYESRISRNYRHRKHPYHDLVGIQSTESTSIEPRWRHMISLSSLPWLADHVVDGSIVFPGSGYICMAIEGILQLCQELHSHRRVSHIELNDVEFIKALLVPDSPQRLEIQLSFTPVRSGKRKDEGMRYCFLVAAFSHGQTWDEHCRGEVKVQFADEKHEDKHQVQAWPADSERREILMTNQIYEQLALQGNVYGPAFTGINRISMGHEWSLATMTVPDAAKIMPAEHCQPHAIHPTTLDIVMHSSLPLIAKKLGAGSVMPIRIAKLVLSTNLSNVPGTSISARATMSNTQHRTGTMNIEALSGEGNVPDLTLSGVELRILAPLANSVDQDLTEDLSWNMLWRPDVDFPDPERFSIHVQRENGRKILALNQLADYYVKRYLTQFSEHQHKIVGEYEALHQWMLEYGSGKTEHVSTFSQTNGDIFHSPGDEISFNSRYPQKKRLVDQGAKTHGSAPHEPNGTVSKGSCTTGSISWNPQPNGIIHQDAQINGSFTNNNHEAKIPQNVDHELVARTGTALSQIVTGTRSALDVVMEQDLLFKVYQSDLSYPSYELLAQYAKELVFKRSRLRIIEIGAGTGGATKPFLQAMKAVNSVPAVYHFTDVSTGFFDRAKVLLSEHVVEYQRLDIEKDPAQQGFELGSYDVVLALNCLHATSNINTTLRHVKSLLHPDGRLVLIELVHPQPFHHLTFGTLSGYWKGAEDRRSAGPFMTTKRWEEELGDASLRLEMELKDSKTTHLNSVIIARHEIESHPEYFGEVCLVSIGAHGEGFVPHLSTALFKKGLQVTVADFDNLSGQKSVTIILDDGQYPLLSNITPLRFEKLCRILRGDSRILWISASNDPSSITNPKKHLITGLARSAHAENSDLRLVTIDVQQSTDGENAVLIHALAERTYNSFFTSSKLLERELVFRDDTIYIPRLLPSAALNEWVCKSEKAAEIDHCDFSTKSLVLPQDGYSTPSNLAFREAEPASIMGDTEIELQVKAIGVTPVRLASRYTEYAGTVASLGAKVFGFSIGDRVMALGRSPCASRPRVLASHTRHIPDNMAYTIAAGLPLASMAASFALFNLVAPHAPKRILLQGINGMVGQALLLLSQRYTSDVCVVASNPSELDLLSERFQLPKDRIIDLHSLHTKNTDLGAQNSRFDTIIVCDSPEISSQITSFLNPFGFLLLLNTGRKQVSPTCQLQLPPNATMRAYDVEAWLDASTQDLPVFLGRSMELIVTGPLPYSKFLPTVEPISGIRDVFTRLDAEGLDDKVVLEVQLDSFVPVVKARDSNYKLPSQATYIIAGGLGDLGRSVAMHLARHGARYIITLSRRSPSSEEWSRVQSMVLGLSKDCRVLHVQCDISREEEVQAAAAKIATMNVPPVKGIVQSAMVLQDRTLDSMNLQDFEIPLATKVDGTLNLKRVFDSDVLEFFVMLSSAASVAGTSGQANYNAGNAVQDALASFNRSSTCHFLAFNPGMIEDAEVTTGNETRVQALSRSGFTPIPRNDLEKMLQYLLSPKARSDKLSMIVAGFSPRSLIQGTSVNGNIRSPMFTHTHNIENTEAKTETILKKKLFKDILAAGTAEELLAHTVQAVSSKLAHLIGLGNETIDLDKPIYEFGVDSLVAIELKNWIKKEFDAILQSLEILDEENIPSLASKILERSKA